MCEVRRRQGFTLIELLIAMLLIGVLISGIVVMTSGTLRFTRTTFAANDQLGDLNDAMGYLALNARRALTGIGCQDSAGGGTSDNPAVSCAIPSSLEVTFGGVTFECNTTSSDGPCLALKVPVVDRASTVGSVTAYELLIYRVVALADWTGDPGMSEGWNGPNTPVLLEYRAPLSCGSPCVLPADPSSVTAQSESLVLANLFLRDAAGQAVAPLAIQTDPASSGLDLLSTTFRLRTRVTGAQLDRSVPDGQVMSMAVTSRP